MRTVICDIDGTLANCVHRVPLLPDYDAFHSKSILDEPYQDVVDLVNSLVYCHVALITGRPEKWRALTMQWLHRNEVVYDELLMRPELNFDRDRDVKQMLYEKAQFEDVWFVIDDREPVVAMWREIGLTCLQPREGDY